MLKFLSVAYGLVLKFSFIETILWHVTAYEYVCVCVWCQGRGIYFFRSEIGEGSSRKKDIMNPLTMAYGL